MGMVSSKKASTAHEGSNHGEKTVNYIRGELRIA